jgi:hypothetical protein
MKARSFRLLAENEEWLEGRVSPRLKSFRTAVTHD